jgi:NAD(P)-dependent dehydrogenase (short-subunit alcohol dehydrogenase family)
LDFCNKICVVTGGANGIGRCITEEFLKAGAFATIADMDKEAGQGIARENPGVLFSCGDVAEEAFLIDFAAQVKERFSKVDYLINNACLSREGILSGCGFDDFNYVLKVGVTAPYMLSRLFLDCFAPGACIVNIASTRAFMSQADTESYSAAKGGILALTHALSVSLAGKARVNSISPGWIDTSRFQAAGEPLTVSEADRKQHPVGRIGEPKDIAKTVLFLCGEEASFITGENITVDGGMTKQMIYHGDFGWSLDTK